MAFVLFVFYNTYLKCAFLFYFRFITTINPEKGSKSLKKGVCVNRKALKLINALTDYMWHQDE